MPPTTHIDFAVRGNQLRVEQVTALLGVAPTSGFNPNEPYVGRVREGDEIVTRERRRPSFGMWHYSTEELIASQSLEEHAYFLLMALEPAKSQIEQMLHSEEFRVRLTLWHVGPAGFEIDSKTMARLAAISESIGVTCFEIAETHEGEALRGGTGDGP